MRVKSPSLHAGDAHDAHDAPEATAAASVTVSLLRSMRCMACRVLSLRRLMPRWTEPPSESDNARTKHLVERRELSPPLSTESLCRRVALVGD